MPNLAWPVDLMLVDDATFGKLSADAAEIVLAEMPVRIPSLRHLIAMKLLRGSAADKADIAYLRKQR